MPVTLQDIADRAGVHRTTASLALRDYPRLSLATREKVKALAQKLGYRANPLVTALMRSRRAGKTVKHAVLAYVTNHPTRFGWRPPEMEQPDFFPGALARAKELGYKLEPFWMAEPGMTPARFANILRTRGIHGLLVGRLPADLHRLDLAWNSFPCVALGLTLEEPRLHHVAENHFLSTHQAMQHCLLRGYRRVGFAFTTPNDYPRVGDRWLGGYYCQQRLLRPSDRIPPYEAGPSQKEFLIWFKRWRPDALVVSLSAPAERWLRTLGVLVPRDVGVVELRDEQPARGNTGIYYDPGKIGALGVEILIGMANRGEVGIPKDPHEVLLNGEWIEGTTLPRRDSERAK